MRSIKPGRGPSAMNAAGSAFAILFGILWTVMAYALTRGSPFPLVGAVFPLFGIVFIGVGVVQLIYNLRNTVAKDRFSIVDITEPGREVDPLEQRFGRAPAPASDSVEGRLRTLDDLRRKGLVTAQEYDARRAKIFEQI